jgi:hypothetical protein
MAADAWGRYNIMIVATIFSGVITLASIAAKNTASIIAVGGMFTNWFSTSVIVASSIESFSITQQFMGLPRVVFSLYKEHAFLPF